MLATLLLVVPSEVGWQSLGRREFGHRLLTDRPGGRRIGCVVGQLPGISSAPRVAVFGGRGFIGSRVCRTLVEAGCNVVSVSLSDAPPSWAAEEPWVQKVQWLSTDGADSSLGGLDAAVSCVGNCRPDPNFKLTGTGLGAFGLTWNDTTMQQQNGDVNERIAEVARRAGARRFAYVSVSSNVTRGFAGALRGYISGRRQAEAAVRRLYGDGAVIVGPSLVYGGGRFAVPGKVYETLASSGPITLLVDAIGRLQTLSPSVKEPWSWPPDMPTKLALTPPVDVDTAARAIAAATLGSTSIDFIDGTTELQRIASEDGEPQLLEAAAAKLSQTRFPPNPLLLLTGAGQSLLKDGGASVDGAPFEGALVGALPFLYPVPTFIFLGALVLSFPRVKQ